MARKTLSWSPVKTVVKKILSQYHPEAVKAEIIWDHVKTEIQDTRITKETIYGILYHMNKEGEIERVSTGWYQLPGKERKVTPDPVWQMGYEEGYEKGKADGRQMAMEEEKQWTWEYIEKEVSDRVRQKIQEYLIAKLVQEAWKLNPDRRRIEVIVELMKEAGREWI